MISLAHTILPRCSNAAASFYCTEFLKIISYWRISDPTTSDIVHLQAKSRVPFGRTGVNQILFLLSSSLSKSQRLQPFDNNSLLSHLSR